MTKEQLEAWQKIKEHFETLEEHKRENFFYTRAVAICNGEPDPMDFVK